MSWIRSIFLGSSLVLLLTSTTVTAGPAVSGGSSPFTYSGVAIATVFQSPLVWQKIFGSVESLVLVQQNAKSVVYQISTTEPVAVLNERGTTTAWKKVPCQILVKVENVSKDPMIPSLQVTAVDFSKCPALKH
jgi:hypothetical protein